MAFQIIFFCKLMIIFNNAVVDESYQSLTVWMRIFCCNTAMGCPAGMADAAVGRAVAFLFYQFF